MSTNKGGIIIYQSPDGTASLDVRLEDETVWLSQTQMVELFQTIKQNVSLHVRNILKEGELEEISTVKEYLTVQTKGQKNVVCANFATVQLVVELYGKRR